MKRSVEVEIAGYKLSIVSDEGPEYVQELADYVDAHVRELSGSGQPRSPHRLALLVAIQIADDLFREKDLHQRFRARVEARLEALAKSLDEHEARLSDI